MTEVTESAEALAKEHDVDLGDVKGTGSDGKIIKKDVEQYVAAQDAASSAGAEPDEPAAEPDDHHDDEIRHGKPKKDDVASVAVNHDGKPAKIDDYGRPETHDGYEG